MGTVIQTCIMSTYQFNDSLSDGEKEEFKDENIEGEELRGDDSICFANATAKKLTVMITMHTVKKQKSEQKKMKAGVQPAVWGVYVEAKRGSADNTYETSEKNTTLFPHRRVDVPIPPVRSVFTSSGKETLASGLVSVVIHDEGKEVAQAEMKAGYGLIVSEAPDGSTVVDQARGRKWYRKFDPWTAKSRANMDPHKNIGNSTNCGDCASVKDDPKIA